MSRIEKKYDVQYDVCCSELTFSQGAHVQAVGRRGGMAWRRRCCTLNMRALWATFLLNTTFTIAQMFGASAAHSLALLGDTGTMVVDSLTYAINIAAEYHKEALSARSAAKVELAASIVSLVALLGVTAWITFDAVVRLTSLDDGTQLDVDPNIMLLFTTINLLVDFGMCGSIVLRRTGGLAGCILGHCCRCRCGGCWCCCARRSMPRSTVTAGGKTPKRESERTERSPHGSLGRGRQPHYTCTLESAHGAGEAADEGGSPHGAALEQLSVLTAELDVSPKRDLNLCSAFAHVLADTMRTLTVMACALMVSIGGFDSSVTDAVGSLIVCTVIALVAAYVGYEAAVQALQLARAGRGDDGSTDNHKATGGVSQTANDGDGNDGDDGKRRLARGPRSDDVCPPVATVEPLELDGVEQPKSTRASCEAGPNRCSSSDV